ITVAQLNAVLRNRPEDRASAAMSACTIAIVVSFAEDLLGKRRSCRHTPPTRCPLYRDSPLDALSRSCARC
ncbi:MAG TPA: hypothetical protein VGW38_02520, partial [Chloroflexota bacterium]|nr:hypothetical protein [Chloroflexota bacterium]